MSYNIKMRGDIMPIIKTNNAEESIALGKKIGSLLKKGSVILLTGDLGAGKTTFTKGIGQALGVKRIINSPTFTIVKIYEGSMPLYHLDLYRLDGVGEDFDLEEYLYGQGICVVEWPYQAEGLLPKEFLQINIRRIGDNEREFELTASGKQYEEVIEKLC